VVTQVIKVDVAADKKSATVTREIEGGQMVLDVPLPAVLSAQKGLNEPRYASLPGIMKAKKKPVDVKNAAAIGITAAAKAKVAKTVPPPARAPGKILQGDDPALKAQELVKLLREEAKVI
jgi:electron transfer flavoprotein beta subunit